MFLKFASARLTWVFIFSLLLTDIHFSIISQIFDLRSLDINVLGLFDYPLDIVNLKHYTTIVIIYKITTVIGIFALCDNIYIRLARILKTIPPNYSTVDPKLNLFMSDVNEILSYQPDNFDKNSSHHSSKTSPYDIIKPNPLLKSTTSKFTLEDYIMDLQNLVGLESVKSEINSIVNLIRVNQLRIQKDLPVHEVSYHMVFTGNPGTGKTTVARILANIFRELGVLSVGHYIEVDRSALVAGYMGQTALKVKEVIERAKGGILFIDEAYTLANENSQNDYGHEVIDTLLKYLEDYRTNLIVIVAGYNNLMKGFINSNPGLKSRFNRFIVFEDYSPKEMMYIMRKMCQKSNYVFSDRAEVFLNDFFSTIFQVENEQFGNGRGVRNLFEKIITVHANRMSFLANPSQETLSLIVMEDVVLAIKEVSKNKM